MIRHIEILKKGKVFFKLDSEKSFIPFLLRCVFILKSIRCAYHETLKTPQGLMCCPIKSDFFLDTPNDRDILIQTKII